jgi:serine protease
VKAMRPALLAVAVLLLWPASGLGAGAPPGQHHASTTGRLLVTLDRDARHGAVAAIAAGGARRAGRRVPEIGLVTVRPSRGVRPAALARRLRRLPGVRHVEAEKRYALRLLPDDPALTTAEPARGAPPGTPVQWWIARHGLPAAWDLNDGRDATVAVIDTGVDATHPELAGKVGAGVDLDETPGHGPATVDEAGHGTHVASMACAEPDNAIGLTGAGLNCSLLVIKSDLSAGSVASSIVEAADRGADAINMSFGADGAEPPARAVSDAVDYAYARGVVMVAAAADAPVEEQGDPANVLQPTGSGAAITAGKGLTVTAATFDDARAPFAGRGTQISLAAYGAFGRRDGPGGLFGAFPAAVTDLERGGMGPAARGCGCRTTFAGDNRYAYIQGTSMAAPIVAATAALIRRLNPDLAVADILRVVKTTARRPGGPDGGWAPDLGWGILDAGSALAAAAELDRTAPRSRATGPRRTRRRSVTVRWAGSDPAPPHVRAAGVARYELLRSAGGGPLRRIATLAASGSHRRTVRVVPGRTYAFSTVAVDRDGNREARPTKPDVRVAVLRGR